MMILNRIILYFKLMDSAMLWIWTMKLNSSVQLSRCRVASRNNRIILKLLVRVVDGDKAEWHRSRSRRAVRGMIKGGNRRVRGLC